MGVYVTIYIIRPAIIRPGDRRIFRPAIIRLAINRVTLRSQDTMS
jgi:hypothetical protein